MTVIDTSEATTKAQLQRARTQRSLVEREDHPDPDMRARALARFDEQIVELQRALGEYQEDEPDAVEVLRRARGPLALRIADGDPDAVVELAELDLQIAAEVARLELQEAAEAERARRDAAAARAAEEAERARLEAELDRKLARRSSALMAFRNAILTAAAAVPEFRALDDACHDLGVHLGRAVPSLHDDAVELMLVHMADAGLVGIGIDLTRVPADGRRRLLERYEADDGPATDESEQTVVVARCSVCTAVGREAIEADVAAGVPLRTVAERHGVSTSALVRHGRHAGNGNGDA